MTALKKPKVARDKDKTPSKKKLKKVRRIAASYSASACAERVDEKAEKVMQMNVALKWCRDHNKGSHACVAANPHLHLVKRDDLQRRIKGTVSSGAEHSAKMILTEVEENDLLKYLVQSNLGRDGKNMAEIGQKVKDILLARRAQNRRGGRSYAKFSTAATRIISGGFPSHKWFTLFFLVTTRL